jgi:iron-sulfur cluster assembly accessory protein
VVAASIALNLPADHGPVESHGPGESVGRLTLALGALNYRSGSVAIGAMSGAKMTTNVIVTERAAQKIGEILRKEPAGTMLRVSVEGGGCSGFQYKFDTDSSRADDDIVIERSGATVLIDPVSLNYMAGSEIDFVDDLIGSSFKINNPKATASCGCGTSFAL